jgi:hypothetical protein
MLSSVFQQLPLASRTGAKSHSRDCSNVMVLMRGSAQLFALNAVCGSMHAARLL